MIGFQTYVERMIDGLNNTVTTQYPLKSIDTMMIDGERCFGEKELYIVCNAEQLRTDGTPAKALLNLTRNYYMGYKRMIEREHITDETQQEDEFRLLLDIHARDIVAILNEELGSANPVDYEAIKSDWEKAKEHIITYFIKTDFRLIV